MQLDEDKMEEEEILLEEFAGERREVSEEVALNKEEPIQTYTVSEAINHMGMGKFQWILFAFCGFGDICEYTNIDMKELLQIDHNKKSGWCRIHDDNFSSSNIDERMECERSASRSRWFTWLRWYVGWRNTHRTPFR